MRDQEAFSPTLPDDEDGYVPAPATPSGEQEPYPDDAVPTFSVDDPHAEPGVESFRVHPASNVEADPNELDDPPVSEPEPVEKPNKNGSRDDWVAYAKSVGYTDEQLESLNRDQIVEAIDAYEAQANA